MAGNDRKPEHGTEAAAHFLAQKWQQPEWEASVAVRSWEPRAALTLLKVGTPSSGTVREHGARAEVRETYLALGPSERERKSLLISFSPFMARRPGWEWLWIMSIWGKKPKWGPGNQGT